MATLVLHFNREAVHHGAEIAAARPVRQPLTELARAPLPGRAATLTPTPANGGRTALEKSPGRRQKQILGLPPLTDPRRLEGVRWTSHDDRRERHHGHAWRTLGNQGHVRCPDPDGRRCVRLRLSGAARPSTCSRARAPALHLTAQVACTRPSRAGIEVSASCRSRSARQEKACRRIHVIIGMKASAVLVKPPPYSSHDASQDLRKRIAGEISSSMKTNSIGRPATHASAAGGVAQRRRPAGGAVTFGPCPRQPGPRLGRRSGRRVRAA